MNFLKQLIKSKTVKNAGWLICGRIIQMAINFFCRNIYDSLSRTFKFWFNKLCKRIYRFFCFGMHTRINSVIVKELVNNREKEGTVLGTSIVLKIISSFLSAISIVCIVSVVDDGEPMTLAVVALCTLGMIFNVFETFNYWFQSKPEIKGDGDRDIGRISDCGDIPRLFDRDGEKRCFFCICNIA